MLPEITTDHNPRHSQTWLLADGRRAWKVRTSPTEARVLARLVAAMGQTVTRDQLYDTMYPGNLRRPESDVLQPIVRRLRIRLEQSGAPLAIRTMYGEGFRLVLLADAGTVECQRCADLGAVLEGNGIDFCPVLDCAAASRLLQGMRVAAAARQSGPQLSADELAAATAAPLSAGERTPHE